MKNKKLKSVMTWLDAGIFPCSIMFSCGFDYEEIMKLLKQKKSDDWLGGLQPHKAFIEGSNYCYIVVKTMNPKTKTEMELFYIIAKKPFEFTDLEYCHLAHEVLHICQHLLPVYLTRENELEAEAYLHTHLMHQCLKSLR